MKIAWIAAVFALASAGDVLDQLDATLTTEGESDEKASEAAACWCQKFKGILSSRENEASASLSRLKSESKVRESQNALLRMKIAEQKAEVGQQQDDLDAGKAWASNDREAAKEALANSKESLEAINEAMDRLPKDQESVHSVLRGIKQRTEQSIEDGEADLGAGSGLLGSKSKMLRLSKGMLARKQEELSSGVAASKQVSAQIELFTSLSEADDRLKNTLNGLCSKLSAAVDERVLKRQQVQVAVSRASARAATVRLALVKTHTSSASTKSIASSPESLSLKAVADTDEDLQELTASSTEIEEKLGQALSAAVNTAASVELSEVDTSVKAAFADLGAAAKVTAEKLPALFDAVRSAAASSRKADSELISELRRQGGSSKSDLDDWS
eukprot:TRINITY_DN41198_c0_g1_i1.p1 TRINITY_DN41198_c0_g1~~TRINITY_DN41198_c0_g1_i1.p1  ORF type:complete len:387 (-),score=110.88 TRINITY_DN41198_c0_g1_i1:89-1249(-)